MAENGLIFFFQAEDGIRDDLVTGVQTCALPISRNSASASSVRPSASSVSASRSRTASDRPSSAARRYFSAAAAGSRPRLEERRVGKEGRCRWVRETLEARNDLRPRG